MNSIFVNLDYIWDSEVSLHDKHDMYVCVLNLFKPESSHGYYSIITDCKIVTRYSTFVKLALNNGLRVERWVKTQNAVLPRQKWLTSMVGIIRIQSIKHFTMKHFYTESHIKGPFRTITFSFFLFLNSPIRMEKLYFAVRNTGNRLLTINTTMALIFFILECVTLGLTVWALWRVSLDCVPSVMRGPCYNYVALSGQSGESCREKTRCPRGVMCPNVLFTWVFLPSKIL